MIWGNLRQPAVGEEQWEQVAAASRSLCAAKGSRTRRGDHIQRCDVQGGGEKPALRANSDFTGSPLLLFMV